jgi:3-deoxy-D-manno-octulosonate 8-phosphate phosphatase (KDO 8-P phosphatase)
MIRKKRPKHFILDVDGVITDGKMIYDRYGKKYKTFGQDDYDSLKFFKNLIKISFVSGDREGYKISKKRVEDMNFKISYVPANIREKWLEKKYGLKNCIYMGDGIFDHLIMKKTFYSIAPKGALNHVIKAANYVTKRKPSERAVAEAVIHLLKKIYNINFLKVKSFEINSAK